ncbi:MAG: cysteine hydrolase family protein [Euryarchaeota archaeon]|nr:cysteine hydrolase family protein [Euryarchaeota archaeon]
MSKSAILLVEFQNQWLAGGFYGWLLRGQLESRRVVENTLRLLEYARASGMMVVHAPLVIDPENRRTLFAHLTFGRVFTRGRRCSEIPGEFLRDGDAVVSGRYSFDVFRGSNLQEILSGGGVERVYVCGFTTDVCVARAMQRLEERGYESYLVSDCTATLCSFLQRRTERKFGGRVVHSESIPELERSRSVTQKA